MGVRSCIKKLRAKGVKITPAHEQAIEQALAEGLSEDQAVRRLMLQAHQNVVDITTRARSEGATIVPVENPVTALVEWQSRAMAKLIERSNEISKEVDVGLATWADIQDLENTFKRMELPYKEEGRPNDLSDDKVLMDIAMRFFMTHASTLKGGGNILGLGGKSHIEVFDNWRLLEKQKDQINNHFLELQKEHQSLMEKRKKILGASEKTFYQAGLDPEVPKLVVHHNISPENLGKADRLGGLPVPSLGIMPYGRSMGDHFGLITLIGREHLGDPGQVPIFDSDGYTVRIPLPEYKKAYAKDSDALWSEVMPWDMLWGGMSTSLGYDLDMGLTRNPNPKRAITALMDNYGVQAYFLQTVHGEDLTPTLKDIRPQYTWSWDNEVVEFFTKDHPELNMDWYSPERRALLVKAGKVIEKAVRAELARRRDARGIPVDYEGKEISSLWESFGYVNSEGEISEMMFRRLQEDVVKKGQQTLDDISNRDLLKARLEGRELEFKDWVEEKVLSIMGEPRIKLNGRWEPYTLENVVRKMKGKLRGTEEGFGGMQEENISEGLMRALASHRFKRLEEMRGFAETSFRANRTEIMDLRHEMQLQMREYTGQIQRYFGIQVDWGSNQFAASDAARRAMIRWAHTKNYSTADFKAALVREGYAKNIPDYLVDRGMDLAMDWLAIPVPYYEGKPQRAVKLSEFAGAVIPSNMDAETRAILKKHGIAIKEYQIARLSELASDFEGPLLDEEYMKQAAIDEFTQQLNNQGERTFFQSEIGFTSGLLTAAKIMPQEKGSAEQMLATLKKQPNVTQEELEYVGVEDWANAMGEFTRDDLIKFIANHGVQLTETLYAGEWQTNFEVDWDVIPTPWEFREEDGEENPYIEWFEIIVNIPREVEVRETAFYKRWRKELQHETTLLGYIDHDAGNVGVRTEEGDWLDITKYAPMNNQTQAHADDAIREYILKRQLPKGAKAPAKWTTYTLPAPWGTYGGRTLRQGDVNHREVLLHIPLNGVTKYSEGDLEFIDYEQLSPYGDLVDIERNNNQFWWVRATNPNNAREAQTFQIPRVNYPTAQSVIDHIVNDKKVDISESMNFRSHAYDERNIIAWIRLTDRVGPEGQKILFIEEIQSDLHQAGMTRAYAYSREKLEKAERAMELAKSKADEMRYGLEDPNLGFWPDNVFDELRNWHTGWEGKDNNKPIWKSDPTSPFEQQLTKKQMRIMRDWLEAFHYYQKISYGFQAGAVLDAPWKGDAWAELSIKRVIRMAAEGGYDQVAWTTGRMQAQRYDITDVASRITWDPRSEYLVVYDLDGRITLDRRVPMDDLDEYIGAERVLEIKRQIDQAEAPFEIMNVMLASHVGDKTSDELSPQDIVLDDDDPFIDSYLRDWLKTNKTAFVIMDENGEILRQSGGEYQAFEYYDGAKEGLQDNAYAHNLPEIKAVEMQDEEGTGLTRRYDNLMVNVANRAIGKLHKGVKIKRGGVLVQGGDMAQKSKIEHDGDKYWVTALDPAFPSDENVRRQFSPKFDSYAEAKEFELAITTGYANVAHGFDITPDIQVRALEGQTLFQNRNRGSITFDQYNRALIRLTQTRDMSTFLHESAHLWLETIGDFYDSPDATPATIDLYTKVLQALGVNSRAEITREHHELFARWFEAYLREGVAPTAELQPTMTTIKGWMIQVYKTLSELLRPGEELNAEVRYIFDRMLATDEQIAASEQMMGYVAMFQSAEEMGISPEVFDAYKQNLQQAHDQEVDRLSKEVLAATNRASQQWWRDELKKVEEQVRKEAYQMQVYKALAALQRGKKPDGSDLDYEPFKLSKESLLRAVDRSMDFVRRIPGRGRYSVYQAEGGVDVDVAATIFGYQNGKELIKALIVAPKLEDYVKAEARRIMSENHPDPLNDPSIQEEAIRNVHNEKRANVLKAELRALRKLQERDKAIVKATKEEAKRTEKEALEANKAQLPTSRDDVAQIKAAAQMLIASKRIRDVQPHTYMNAERRAGRAAFAALEKKNYAEAYRQKLIQLMNFEAYRAAVKAVRQSERDHKYLKSFEKTSKRKRMGKAGYLEQIDAILEGIDLRKLSLSRIDRERIQQELLVALAEGDLVLDQAVIQSLIVRGGKNWKDFTFEEFGGIRDLVKQLEHRAKRELEIIVNGEKVIIQEAVDDVAGSIIANNKKVVIDNNPHKGSGKSGVRELIAMWLRPSSIARVLDKSGWGAVTKRVIVPIRRAYAEKLIPWQHKASVAIAEIYKKHYSNKELKQFMKPMGALIDGQEWTKAQALVIALNWGSESNRAALLGGVRIDEFGEKELAYPQRVVDEVLATLDARDWAFVQDIWDYEGSFYEQMAEAETRRRGIAPKKIEPISFDIRTSDGQTITVRGGYHPLQYDSRHGGKITEKEFEDFYKRMTKGGFVTANTRAGSTYERVQNHGNVVKLSLNTIEQNLRELLRDLAIGDEVNLANRILTAKEVTNAARNTESIEAIKELQLWLSDAAVGELPAQKYLDKALSWTRVGFTKSKLAFNAFVTALQLTGVFQTMAVVGSAQYMRGAGKFLSNPAANYKMVMETSPFMNARYGEMAAWDKDVADTKAFLQNHFGGIPTKGVVMWDTMAHYYFWPIAKMQSLVDVTTWMAAYEKGANELGIEDTNELINYADSVVERAQTSGFFSDRSGIERGTIGSRTRQAQFVRIWTTLISYMLAKGNIAYEKGKMTNFRKPSEVVTFATDLMMLYMLEGIVSALLYGQWPDDDDEENIAGWVATVTAESILSGIPFIREFSSAKYGGGQTPVGSLIVDSYKFVEQMSQGELDEPLIKSGVKVAGTLTHTPASQTNRLVEFFFEWSEDDAQWYEMVIGREDEE